MEESGQAGTIVQTLDAVLGRTKPFGDSSYIQDQMERAFLRRLGTLGQKSDSAAQLVANISRLDPTKRSLILGDPVLRAAIQQAIAGFHDSEIETILSEAECTDVFDYSRYLIESDYRSASGNPWPGGECVLNQALGQPRLWDPTNASASIYTTTFAKLVMHEYGESLRSPTDTEWNNLLSAKKLLDRLVPLSGGSALTHVHVIGVFDGTGAWKNIASSSQFRLTGAIFLNGTALRNPWWVAEHLFHEALHQKLYDFRHGHSLLTRDSSPEPEQGTSAISLWNTPGIDDGNVWDSNRVLAAFHVYVHLALFASVAEAVDEGIEQEFGDRQGGGHPITTSRQAMDRGAYLSAQLLDTCREDLGRAGLAMVEWLTSVLEFLDSSRRPLGSVLHLLLDRYQTEAARIHSMTLGGLVTPDVRAALHQLAVIEASIVDSLQTRVSVAEIEESAERLIKFDDNQSFSDIRRSLIPKLQRWTMVDLPEGSKIPTDEKVEAILKGMIEGSSRIVGALAALAELPVDSSRVAKA